MTVFKKPARKVHTVWLHCSAASNPNITAADVDRWHRDRGWSGIGYHYFIRTDGMLELGRDIEKTGAHVRGHNTGSIGICLNGLHLSDFTEAQFSTLNDLCGEINEAYGGNVRFRGHNEVAAKACPVYDPQEVLPIDPNGMWIDENVEDEPDEMDVVVEPSPGDDGPDYRFYRIGEIADEAMYSLNDQDYDAVISALENVLMHARVGRNMYRDEQRK